MVPGGEARVGTKGGFFFSLYLLAQPAAVTVGAAATTAQLHPGETSKAASDKTGREETKPRPTFARSGAVTGISKPVSGQRPSSLVRLPTYQNVRFEEDWSVLSASRQREGWQALKYLPLSPGGNVYMSVGGQVRFRTEFWNDFGFGGSGQRDDTFGLFRLRLHGDFFFGPHLRLFVEGKSALADGRELPGGNRTLDTDSVAFQNVFFDVRVPLEGKGSLTFRVGRQELEFGKQRLVSPLDWSNTRPRTFDGFSGIFKKGSWRVDGFWTRHAKVRKFDFNPHDTGTDFFGIQAAGRLASWTTEFYWFGLDRERASYGGLMAPETRQTLGTHLAGKLPAGWDLDFEGAYQFGNHGQRDIDAFMVATQIGYRFPSLRTAPRVYAGFDYASGDDDPGNGEIHTFNQLFPLGHAYFGFIDMVGRQNIVSFTQGVSLKVLPKSSLKADHHFFWRANKNDALYNAGGGIVRSGGAGLSREVGSELDLTFSHKLNAHLVTTFGYSHLFPGGFIKESGPSRGIDFGYIAVQYTF
ncbi:MAG: alginate export family protein [Acidobacteriota bacterium]